MVMMVMAALAALQRRRHLVEADRAVAIGVELAEHVVGLREVGAAGAERVFEFGLADLAVAIGIDLREQVLQRVRRRSMPAGRCRPGRRRPGFAPRSARSWSPARSANIRDRRELEPGSLNCVEAARDSNGLGGSWPKPVVCGDVDFDEVSDCRRPSRTSAAPRASNMAELRQMPRLARPTFSPDQDQQTPCQRKTQ